MRPAGVNTEGILEQLEALGEVRGESVRRLSRETGVPEADIWGVASFYHLIPKVPRRVCSGLSCRLSGAEDVLAEFRAPGVHAEPVSCLGNCDRPVAVLDERHEQVGPRAPTSLTPDDDQLPINLAGVDRQEYAALAAARKWGPERFLEELEASGLQGRGGAGFPAAFKWRSVRGQLVKERYVVCNADEAEPGTFKDREVMLKRPHLLLEGLAIAAWCVESTEIHLYVRGAFGEARRSLEQALLDAGEHLSGFNFRFTSGHGAYICGEETALLESLEGKRGMPRLKPPYPTEVGFRGCPTLVNNVETLACVPSILLNGGEWFREQGRTEPGTKLYCLSGHVARPGVYELPLGATLDELVEAAGGYLGTPHAFSPGGASSGFLPMKFRDLPLDFGSLAKVGSMLGSAGVVVLNDTVDIAEAAREQLAFFEFETCGQCAPCRIGTRVLRQAADRFLLGRDPSTLDSVEDVAWEMEEGSICGLGIAAPLALTSAMKHFPEAFAPRRDP